MVKCNPDAPQLPVRVLALQQGKRLFMAVPRLREERCFLDLIVTPDATIRCPRRHRRPRGIVWGALTDEKIAEVPLLARLAREKRRER